MRKKCIKSDRRGGWRLMRVDRIGVYSTKGNSVLKERIYPADKLIVNISKCKANAGRFLKQIKIYDWDYLLL